MIMHYTELGKGLRLVKLHGRLDMVGANEIESEFAASCAADHTTVLVDLSDVEFLTSFGMRLLVSNAKTVAERGGRMVVAGPSPHVKDTLDVSGVSSIIPIYESVASARSALHQP